jgi:hypothetical protein
MKLVQAIKSPFVNIKDTLIDAGVLVLAVILIILGPYLIQQGYDWAEFLQMALMVPAGFGFMWTIGSISTRIKGDKKELKEVANRGVAMVLVLVIYAVPYQLSWYIYGALGQFLTSAYLIALIIVLPAIVISTAELGVKGGFNIMSIGKRLATGNYIMAYAVSLPIIAVYSLGSYLFGIALMGIPQTATQLLFIYPVYLFAYLFCGFCAIITVLGLFGVVDLVQGSGPSNEGPMSSSRML